MYYPTIIFSDFDGTVTTTDTLEGFMQLFMEEDIGVVSRRMFAQGYSIKEGVREILSQVTEADYLANTHFFEQLPIREGFSAFLDFLKERELPFVVISGGIREMVETTLAPYREKVLDVYAARVSLETGHAVMTSEFESPEENVSKGKVMALYDYGAAISIGDSYTDVQMALASDVVFARDRLAEAMEKEGKPYYAYDTFYDIIDKLKKIL